MSAFTRKVDSSVVTLTGRTGEENLRSPGRAGMAYCSATQKTPIESSIEAWARYGWVRPDAWGLVTKLDLYREERRRSLRAPRRSLSRAEQVRSVLYKELSAISQLPEHQAYACPLLRRTPTTPRIPVASSRTVLGSGTSKSNEVK